LWKNEEKRAPRLRVRLGDLRHVFADALGHRAQMVLGQSIPQKFETLFGGIRKAKQIEILR
jgi:hypothetical protein